MVTSEAFVLKDRATEGAAETERIGEGTERRRLLKKDEEVTLFRESEQAISESTAPFADSLNLVFLFWRIVRKV